MEAVISSKNNILLKKAKFTANINPGLALTFLCICEKSIVRYFLLAFSYIPIVGNFSSFLLPAAYIVLFIIYVFTKSPKVRFLEFVVPLFLVMSIILALIFYRENDKYIFDINIINGWILPCFKFYFVAVVLTADKKTVEICSVASCVGILVEAAFVLFYMIPRGLLDTDEMSRAYNILPNVLLVLFYALYSKRVFAWVSLFVGVFYILSMGTRGPVIIFLAYVALKTLTAQWRKKGGMIVAVIGLILLVAFFSSDLYMSFLNNIRHLLKSIGVSTRVIDLTIEGTVVSHTSGRDKLFSIAWQKLLERPLLGYGIFGEWQFMNWNAHNMYLELLLHYGFIVGGAIIIWMVFISLRAYFKCKNVLLKELILIWICLVFVRAFFGGSYINYNTFFLLGLCLNAQRGFIGEKIISQRRKNVYD